MILRYLQPLLLAAILSAFVCASSPIMAETPHSSFNETQRIVRLTASDGHKVVAILTVPDGGINVNTPAIIHLHGGPGASPLDGSGPWIAEGLAKRGYTTIAPFLRHGTDVANFSFQQQNKDIAAVINFTEELGFAEVILTGSSFGSISVTRYLVDTQDPRVAAAVHFAPTADMNTWAENTLGRDEYRRAVDDYAGLVSAGRGDQVVNRLFTHEAKTWLDLWGPASLGVNSLLFDKIQQPMLLLAGDADPFSDEARLEQLKAAAVSSPKVDYVFYRGGIDHSFYPKSTHSKVIKDVATWLKSIGFGPMGRAKMKIVTNHDDNKPSMQRALLYLPDSVGPNAEAFEGAAFLFVNGWADDALRSVNERLARYVAGAGFLALNMQTQRGEKSAQNSFELSRSDIGGWIDWLEERGTKKVVLVGEGVGATRVTDYMAAQQDRRVAALALVSPAPDGAQWLRGSLGVTRYEELLSEAIAEVSLNSSALMQFDAPPWNSALPQTRQRYFLTPEGFLRTFGPQAPVAENQLKAVNVPVLKLAVYTGGSISTAAVANLALAADADVISQTARGNQKSPSNSMVLAKRLTEWVIDLTKDRVRKPWPSKVK